jgi:hypothetical protein
LYKDETAKMRKTCQEAGERERDLRAAQDSLESARQQINQLNRRVEEEQALSFQLILRDSLADPDPPDPHVFGPPGSGSFYHHAKIVRKTLIPTFL